MRRSLSLIAVLGVVVAVAGTAAAAKHPAAHKSVLSATTGTLRALDLSQITVAHTTCSFNTVKMEALTENFDLGENVAIGCRRGRLETIKLAPLTGPTHRVPYLHLTAAPTPPPTSSGGHGFSFSFTQGELTSGSAPTAAAPVSSSVSATGPITALTQTTVIGTITATSITVGDATCAVLTGAPFLQSLQVGTVASISCTGPDSLGLSSSGTISVRSP